MTATIFRGGFLWVRAKPTPSVEAECPVFSSAIEDNFILEVMMSILKMADFFGLLEKFGSENNFKRVISRERPMSASSALEDKHKSLIEKARAKKKIDYEGMSKVARVMDHTFEYVGRALLIPIWFLIFMFYMCIAAMKVALIALAVFFPFEILGFDFAIIDFVVPLIGVFIFGQYLNAFIGYVYSPISVSEDDINKFIEEK